MSTIIENKDNIITITLDRPKALNAINKSIMTSLNHFFQEEYKNYGDFHGVIIKGAGEKAFAAGADITEFTELDRIETTRMSKFGHDTYAMIESFHVPVIAVVDGFALGGGCELALACHMRICTEKSRFGQPEVNLGLTPGYGGTQRFVQILGKAKGLEYLLTAAMIDPETALTLGLVNYVMEDMEKALEKATGMLNEIGTKGPNAVAETIKAVYAGQFDVQKGYSYEAEAFGRTMVSDEAKEGVGAFLEKRKANFRQS